MSFEGTRCDHEGAILHGRIAKPGFPNGGTVLMFPGATGPGPSFDAAMKELAGAGYFVIHANMYGKEVDMSSPQTAGQGFAALLQEPERLRDRAVAWFEQARRLEGVDPDRIAAIGYCFGGRCVLELARSGAAVRAVSSFHGLLATHAPARKGVVLAKVAVWTGGDDPYASRQDAEALQAELDAAEADYQFTLFAKARHAFMDPDHDGFAPGIAYDPLAHRIGWAGTRALLAETVGRG